MRGLTSRDMVKIGMFTAMACITAMILRFGTPAVVPFSPMPMIVVLAGGLLGSTGGALSMALYLLLGLVGLPVFASPPYGGLTYVVKPTFGFMFGYVAGAWVTGLILSNKPSLSSGPRSGGYLKCLLAMVAGVLVVYVLGLPYLYLILNVYLGKPASVLTVLKIGFLPFVGLDLVKAVVASHLTVAVWRRLGKANVVPARVQEGYSATGDPD